MSPWWLRGSEDAAPENPADEQAAVPVEPLEGGEGESSTVEPEPNEGEGEEETEPGAAEGETERSGRTRRRRGRRRGKGGASVEGASEPEPAPAEEEPLPPPVRPAVRPAESTLASGLEHLAREIAAAVAPPARQEATAERKIAMFCDLENVALGVRDSEIKKFDIELVLERLLEKGKIIVKRAYCDWERYSEYKKPFHEAAVELIDIPQRHYSGKNSADIKMVVDAMDLCYAKEHLDTFVLVSGDSDFSPLVSKLKENDKRVIGLGVRNSSSALLVDNCDEFIFYEDLWRDQHAAAAPQLDGLPKKKAEVFALMTDSISALMRENYEVIWGSMIKQTMKRKKPSFDEGAYGYRAFSALLEDAARHELIKLKKDQRSGTYVVTGFTDKR